MQNLHDENFNLLKEHEKVCINEDVCYASQWNYSKCERCQFSSNYIQSQCNSKHLNYLKDALHISFKEKNTKDNTAKNHVIIHLKNKIYQNSLRRATY